MGGQVAITINPADEVKQLKGSDNKKDRTYVYTGSESENPMFAF